MEISRKLKGIVIITILLSILTGCSQKEELSETFPVTDSTITDKEEKLDFKGSDCLIVTVFRTSSTDRAYIIKLFGNGVIEASQGERNWDVTNKKITGNEKNLLSKVLEYEEKQLTEEKIREINKLVGNLELKKFKKYKKRNYQINDGFEKMIFINNESYYLYDINYYKHALAKLTNQIIENSPIEVNFSGK